jgi:hypothetical protein
MADWYKVVIQGKDEEVRAFVEGLIVGADAYGEIFFLEDLDMEHHQFLEILKRWAHLEKPIAPILVTASLKDLIVGGISDEAQDLRLKVVSVRQVLHARFEFHAECFSRIHAEKIRAIFCHPPEGVELAQGSAFEERVDPDAAGTEMYSPVHEYELKCGGQLYGDPKKVIELYQEAVKEPLIKLKPVRFDFA